MYPEGHRASGTPGTPRCRDPPNPCLSFPLWQHLPPAPPPPPTLLRAAPAPEGLKAEGVAGGELPEPPAAIKLPLSGSPAGCGGVSPFPRHTMAHCPRYCPGSPSLAAPGTSPPTPPPPPPITSLTGKLRHGAPTMSGQHPRHPGIPPSPRDGANPGVGAPRAHPGALWVPDVGGPGVLRPPPRAGRGAGGGGWAGSRTPGSLQRPLLPPGRIPSAPAAPRWGMGQGWGGSARPGPPYLPPQGAAGPDSTAPARPAATGCGRGTGTPRGHGVLGVPVGCWGPCGTRQGCGVLGWGAGEWGSRGTLGCPAGTWGARGMQARCVVPAELCEDVGCPAETWGARGTLQGCGVLGGGGEVARGVGWPGDPGGPNRDVGFPGHPGVPGRSHGACGTP